MDVVTFSYALLKRQQKYASLVTTQDDPGKYYENLFSEDCDENLFTEDYETTISKFADKITKALNMGYQVSLFHATKPELAIVPDVMAEIRLPCSVVGCGDMLPKSLHKLWQLRSSAQTPWEITMALPPLEGAAMTDSRNWTGQY